MEIGKIREQKGECVVVVVVCGDGFCLFDELGKMF